MTISADKTHVSVQRSKTWKGLVGISALMSTTGPLPSVSMLLSCLLLQRGEWRCWGTPTGKVVGRTENERLLG